MSSKGPDPKDAAVPAASLVDESIIADFVAESRDHLNAIEPDLLTMEQGGAGVSKDLLNRVFRAIHSIKGGAGFLAFEGLKGLSHSLENVLMLVRDGRLAVDPEVMDAVFAGLDRLRAMLDDIQASDRVPCAAELERFRTILERKGGGAGGPGEGPDPGQRRSQAGIRPGPGERALGPGPRHEPVPRGGPSCTGTSRTRGPRRWPSLTNALSVGEVLDAYIDLLAVAELEHCLEGDLQVSLLFGTVLEPDLAAMALDLPAERVTMLDMKALRKRMKELPVPAAVETANQPGAEPAPAPPPATVPDPVDEGAEPGAGPVAQDRPRAPRPCGCGSTCSPA